MRAREFIQEGIVQQELLQAARYIAKWLAEYKPLRAYTVPQMFGGTNKVPFKVNSPELQRLLGKDGLTFTTNPLIFKGKHPSTVGGFSAEMRKVAISPDILDDTDMVASVLAHELTHGTDVYRYGGRLTMSPTGDLSGAKYLAQPHEVNARFTQALYDLAKSPNRSADVAKNIDANLAKHNLARETFPPGPSGQKQYDRLRSRAYQFIQQMEPLVDPGQPVAPAMFDRIRKMVTTFATF